MGHERLESALSGEAVPNGVEAAHIWTEIDAVSGQVILNVTTSMLAQWERRSVLRQSKIPLRFCKRNFLDGGYWQGFIASS